MSDWRFERPENLIHVHEREEARCALQAAEDAGELDTFYWDRPSPGDFDWGDEERAWEHDEDFEGHDE